MTLGHRARSLRWAPFFLLLVSTMVASQDQTTVVEEIVTEVNTGTAQTVFFTSTATPTTSTIVRPTTLSTFATKPPSPTSLVPTNLAPKSEPSSGPPKVVIIAASLGGAGVLAAVCMGIYFCCCRSSKRKKRKMPIVSDEFFAPMAIPVREPRLPVLPPTPVSRTPPKEQQMRTELDGGSRWPLADSRGASPAPHPAPPPRGWGAGGGGDYRVSMAEHKRDSHRGPSPPPTVYRGAYVGPQGYAEGAAYGDLGAYRNPEWDHREDVAGRIPSGTAELPSGARRVVSGSSRAELPS